LPQHFGVEYGAQHVGLTGLRGYQHHRRT
jgi:hypothetical protein